MIPSTHPSAMPETKHQLLELIEAYAAAKSTNNAMLVQSAATALISFMEGVSIVAEPSAPTTTEDLTTE